MLEYRGYRASVEFHPEAGVHVGLLLDIPDTVSFTAPGLEELKEEMAAAVDRYIDFCLEWGRPTHTDYSSDYTVRVVA